MSMNQSNEKFRISLSVPEMASLLSLIQANPDFMMENLDLVSRIEKAKRKAEFNLLAPAYVASGQGTQATQKVVQIAQQLQTDRALRLIERLEAGETLELAEMEEVVTYKAEKAMQLSEAEQRIFNVMMARKIGL